MIYIHVLPQRDKPSKRLYSIKPRKRNTHCNLNEELWKRTIRPVLARLRQEITAIQKMMCVSLKQKRTTGNQPTWPAATTEIRVDTCWKPTSSQVWSQIGTRLTNMDCVSSCDMPFVCHHKSLNEGLVCFFQDNKSHLISTLVNCPTQPTCIAHCVLCICQLSRRWQPSLALSKMFEPFLRP